MLEFILAIIAIENIADILTSIDLLQPFRSWFQTTFPRIGKLADCKYCQIFWISMIFFCIGLPPHCLLLALAAHRIGFLFSEFCNRYINRAPLNIFVQQPTADQGSDS